jgi:CRISPR-associated protein (TIGR03984 family)
MTTSVKILEANDIGPKALSETIATFATGSQALLYTPSAVVAARVTDDGHFEFRDAPPEPLDQAYEIIAFAPTWELRWVREGTSGRASVVIDGDGPCPTWEASTGVPCVATNDLSYLVWGVSYPPESSEGWTRMIGSRVGAIDLPLASSGVVELRLEAREYLVEAEHGVVAVGLQRLMRLKVAPKSGENADG